MSAVSSAENVPHYDVVIATPGFSMKAEYVKSLVSTCATLDDLGITYTFLNRQSSFVATARELTAIDSPLHDYNVSSIGSGRFTYNKIFWIDSDIEWEPVDFIKLYSSDLPIVSGLYQLDTAGSVAVGFPNKHGVPTRVNKIEFLLHDEPVEVGGVGFGFLAVKTGVFEDLPRPWFLIAKIQWEPTRDLKVNMGEDYSWCELAKANGYKIWLDPTVKVRHHKETVYEI